MTALRQADAQHAGDHLVESLQRWRDADRSSTAAPRLPGLRAIDAHRAIIERAKGALMLRFGLDSHEAFALLVRWSRLTHTAVHTLADTLVRGICDGDVQTGKRHAPLMRWLDEQLRRREP